MKYIIRSDEIECHSVEKFKFKVLSSSKTQESEIEETVCEQPVQEVETKEDMADKDERKDDTFVEELLKKTDELSSNVIKLQMQMEKQQEEFEKRLQEERDRSLQEGKKVGFDEARASYEDKERELKEKYLKSISLLDELYKNIQDFFQKAKNELSETAIDIAKEVISKEVSQNSKEVALSLSKALIKQLKDASKISIKVNPEDFEYIKSAYESDLRIEVLSDSAITQGGVVVLSELGNLDGEIQTRIESAKQIALG